MPGLFIDIEARFARFQDALDRIERDTKRTTRRLEDAFSGVRSAIAAMVPAISLGAFASMVKSAADLQDEMGKLSQRVGVSVESLSALNYAASLADVTTEQLGVGLRQLAKNMLDTQAGTGEAKEAFKALGISVVDSAGNLRSTDQVFMDVAERFAQMEDGAGKTALAMRIFGKSGADLIPLLNAGRDGLAKLSEEAKRLGVVFDEQAAKAAERFNDNLTRLSKLFDGMKVQIGNELIPVVSDLVDQFLRGIEIAGGFWKAVGLFGTLNPAKSAGDQIKELNAQLDALARRREVLSRNPRADLAPLDAAEQRVKKQIEFLKFLQQQEALKLGQDITRDEVQRFGGGAVKTKAPPLPDEAALKQTLDERRKLMEQDIKGWVEYADKIFQLADEENLALAKINEEYWKEQERLRQEDIKGWVAHAEEVFRLADKENLALARLQEEARRTNDIARELGLTFSSAFEDAIVQGRKLSDVLRGLAQDVLRIFVRKTAVEPLATAASGFFKSIFAGIFHRGGIVGESAPTRAVPAAAFIGAPRLHGGGILASDEVPAILRRGEAVFTPGQLVALRAGGGNTYNVSITVDALGSRVQGDAGQAAELGRRIEAAVKDVLVRERRPGGLLAAL